jgi:hypothetical protein
MLCRTCRCKRTALGHSCCTALLCTCTRAPLYAQGVGVRARGSVFACVRGSPVTSRGSVFVSYASHGGERYPSSHEKFAPPLQCPNSHCQNRVVSACKARLRGRRSVAHGARWVGGHLEVRRGQPAAAVENLGGRPPVLPRIGKLGSTLPTVRRSSRKMQPNRSHPRPQREIDTSQMAPSGHGEHGMPANPSCRQ